MFDKHLNFLFTAINYNLSPLIFQFAYRRRDIVPEKIQISFEEYNDKIYRILKKKKRKEDLISFLHIRIEFEMKRCSNYVYTNILFSSIPVHQRIPRATNSDLPIRARFFSPFHRTQALQRNATERRSGMSRRHRANYRLCFVT